MIKSVLNTSYDFGEQNAHLIGVTSRGLDSGHLSKIASSSKSIFEDIDIKPEKGKAVVHVVAMGAAPHYPSNKNGDLFFDTDRAVEIPMGEDIQLTKGLDKTFITFETDAKVFKEHRNTKNDKVYGDVLKARYNDDMRRVELLLSIPIDEWKPELERLESGAGMGFSMSCALPFDICGHCGKQAKTRKDYCFIPDTLVTMADGHVVPIKDIKAGDFVLSSEGETTEVIAVFERTVSEPVVTIKHTLNGFPVTCTKNHPVLSSRREEGLCYYSTTGKCFPGNRSECKSECLKTEQERAFIPAGDLRHNDFVFSPGFNHGTGPEVNHTTEDAWVLGLFVAEGSYGKVKGVRKTLQFSLHENETEFTNYLDEYFKRKYPRKTGSGIKVYGRSGSKGVSARFYSQEACAVFHKAIEEYAHSKYLKLTDILYSKSALIEYVRGVWDGDGYFGPREDRLNTASIHLAFQLGHSLTSLGLSNYVGIAHDVPGGPTNRSNLRTQYYVNTRFSPEKWNHVTRAVVGKLQAGTVKTVEESHYNGPVHNIETTKGTYVANGICVHNCDHLKYDLNQITSEGHQIAAINDNVKFFDISGVSNPADRIAFGLLKAASSGVVGGAELAEMLRIPVPLLPERSKFASILKKLAEMEKTIESDKVELVASNPSCAAAEVKDLPKEVLKKIAASGLTSEQTLGALADVKVTLSIKDFLKIVLGEKFQDIEPHVSKAEESLPGVFSRMCVNPKVQDGVIALPETPFPFSLGHMLKDITGSNGFGSGPKRRRVTITILKGRSPFTVKSASVTTNDVEESLAQLYGQYKVALCHKFSDDNDLTFTSVLAHYIKS